MSQTKEVFTTGEVAQLCGVTHRTVVNWIQRGQLASYKLPGTRGDNRIRLETLIEFMQANALPLPIKLKQHNQASNAEPLILVVDDDGAMARAIARTLKHAGYQTACAHDGFEAGAMFAELKPVLVTLDLQMPKLDGLYVLTQIKKTSDTGVIVISAASDDLLDEARHLGADAVLSKPYENNHLIRTVAKLL